MDFVDVDEGQRKPEKEGMLSWCEINLM